MTTENYLEEICIVKNLQNVYFQNLYTQILGFKKIPVLELLTLLAYGIEL